MGPIRSAPLSLPLSASSKHGAFSSGQSVTELGRRESGAERGENLSSRLPSPSRGRRASLPRSHPILPLFRIYQPSSAVSIHFSRACAAHPSIHPSELTAPICAPPPQSAENYHGKGRERVSVSIAKSESKNVLPSLLFRVSISKNLSHILCPSLVITCQPTNFSVCTASIMRKRTLPNVVARGLRLVSFSAFPLPPSIPQSSSSSAQPLNTAHPSSKCRPGRCTTAPPAPASRPRPSVLSPSSPSERKLPQTELRARPRGCCCFHREK